MTEQLSFHEYAQLFPMLPREELDALADDIKINGLLEAITLYDGEVLDGRNRYVACKAAAVIPRFEQYTGDDPLAFVISKNLHRRHLTAGQRAAIAARMANMPVGRHWDNSANLQNNTEISQTDAATMMNVSPRSVASVKAVERDAPDLLPQIESGKLTVNKAVKEVAKRRRDVERAELAELAAELPADDRWLVEVADLRTYQTAQPFDFIITDPPYPREYLPLYEVLAQRALDWLKPGGLVVAMCGQSYLDQIVALMGKHLEYYWTGCYLTPGQPTQLRMRQVNTSWKPVLIYGRPGDKYTGKVFGDVWVSDRPDKTHHEWGQSESGMLALLKQIVLPGKSVFDPFCGAGTTGVAALKHGCTFGGIDLDEIAVRQTRARLAGVVV